MSAATGGGGGGATIIRGTDLESHVHVSSLSEALQGGLLLPVEEDGLRMLVTAMREQGYCPIVVDDNNQAQSIRAHFKALRQQGKDWSHLPAQRQAEDAASSPPRYHGYLAAPDPLYHGYLAAPDKRKEVVDVRVMQGEEDALLCRLPTGRPAFTAMERVARLVLQIISKGLGLKPHCLEDDLLDAYPLESGQWSSSILSSIHYQASQHRVQAGVERVMAPSHVDRGVLTLVYSDTPGLQARQGANGWVDLSGGVGTQRGSRSLVLWVLAGRTLERATGGAISAVEHRVVDHSYYMGRHSLALKLRGHPSSLLHPGLLAQHMTVPMPLLHDFRKPITVREFEAGFASSHRSITYADQPQHHRGHAARSASQAVEGGGGGESRGVKRERSSNTSEDDGGRAAGESGGATDARNDQPEATGEAGDKIRLVFRDVADKRANVVFMVHMSTRMGKCLEMYAELAGVPQNTLRLFLDGNRLLDEQTPAICRLEDGEEIFVMAEMMGD